MKYVAWIVLILVAVACVEAMVMVIISFAEGADSLDKYILLDEVDPWRYTRQFQALHHSLVVEEHPILIVPMVCDTAPGPFYAFIDTLKSPPPQYCTVCDKCVSQNTRGRWSAWVSVSIMYAATGDTAFLREQLGPYAAYANKAIKICHECYFRSLGVPTSSDTLQLRIGIPDSVYFPLPDSILPQYYSRLYPVELGDMYKQSQIEDKQRDMEQRVTRALEGAIRYMDGKDWAERVVQPIDRSPQSQIAYLETRKATMRTIRTALTEWKKYLAEKEAKK